MHQNNLFGNFAHIFDIEILVIVSDITSLENSFFLLKHVLLDDVIGKTYFCWINKHLIRKISNLLNGDFE